MQSACRRNENHQVVIMKFLLSITGEAWDTLVQSKQKSREISRKLVSFSPSPKLKSLRKQVTLGWQTTRVKMAFPSAFMTIWICEIILYLQALYYIHTIFKKPKLIIIWILNNVFQGLTNVRVCLGCFLSYEGRQGVSVNTWFPVIHHA